VPEEDITRTDLLPRLRDACNHALKEGALGPIETESERITDDGIEFVVRTISNLVRKEAASKPGNDDPFAPPHEPALHLGTVPPDHVALLNKFPVIENHLLVVTREFRDQQAPLETPDFEALLRVLARFDALAFYNSGPHAGASQPHCHLQFIPRVETLPLEPAIASEQPMRFPCAATPFDRGWLDDPIAGSHELWSAYRDLLQRIGRVDPASGDTGGSYNLLVTRDHAWAVPRARAWYGPINVNALGYAGLLLAADRDQARLIRDDGPLHVIASTVDSPAPV
jgi:ATP adenylyltransferase